MARHLLQLQHIYMHGQEFITATAYLHALKGIYFSYSIFTRMARHLLHLQHIYMHDQAFITATAYLHALPGIYYSYSIFICMARHLLQLQHIYMYVQDMHLHACHSSVCRRFILYIS